MKGSSHHGAARSGITAMRWRARLAATLLIMITSSPAMAQWVDGGVSISQLGTPQAANVVPDAEGGSIIFWKASRNFDPTHIYAHHINLNGILDPRWGQDGISICTVPSLQLSPTTSPDGFGGAIVAWLDGRSAADPYTSGFSIYAQRVKEDGSIATGWAGEGVPACADTCTTFPVSIANDSQGGVFVAWTSKGNEGDVFLQHISPDGTVATGWPPGGIVVCNAPGWQLISQALPDASGGVYLLWYDYRIDDPDVYCTHVSASGSTVPGWPVNGLLISRGSGSFVPTAGSMCSDGLGGTFVFWSEYFQGGYTFRAKRFNSDGSTPSGWSSAGAVLSSGIWASNPPDCTPDGSGGALVAWGVFYGSDTRIYADKVSADGIPAPGWGDGRLLATGSDFKTAPRITSDAGGGAYVAWSDARSGSPPPFDVFAQHLTTNGEIASQWPAEGVSLSQGIQLQSLNPSIVATGSGTAIAAWESYPSGIYAQRLAQGGAESFSFALRSVDSEPDNVRLTWVASQAFDMIVTIYRRAAAATWDSVATAHTDVNGHVLFEDRNVKAGAHYEYRLGAILSGQERYFGEVRVDVPLFLLSLPPLRPNPSVGDMTFTFTLPTGAPAEMQLFDVAGRMVDSRDVGSMGVGRHAVTLGAGKRLAAGMYVARLVQGERSATTRAILIH